jgi:hypothetical protein
MAYVPGDAGHLRVEFTCVGVKFTKMEQEQRWGKLTGERTRIPGADEITQVPVRGKSIGLERKLYFGAPDQVGPAFYTV